MVPTVDDPPITELKADPGGRVEALLPRGVCAGEFVNLLASALVETLHHGVVENGIRLVGRQVVILRGDHAQGNE